VVTAARAARQTSRVVTLPVGHSSTRTRIARLAIGWVFFANGAALGSWVPHIPDAKHALGLTHGLLGLALLGMAAGSLLGLPLSGVLTARYGSRKTTTAAILAMLLATPLPILASGPPLFAIALGLLGMANGAVDVAMNTQAIAVQDRYGRAIMSGFHGLFSIGGLAGAAAAALAMSAGVVAASHLLASIAVLLLPTFAAIALLLPTTSTAARRDFRLRADRRRARGRARRTGKGSARPRLPAYRPGDRAHHSGRRRPAAVAKFSAKSFRAGCAGSRAARGRSSARLHGDELQPGWRRDRQRSR